MVEVIINGHAGRLEGRYHQAKRPDAPVALILHPHPQYGGTMNNKVAYALFTCFRDLGFSVLRFNFRGVGRSQGEFEDGPGELSDATIAPLSSDQAVNFYDEKLSDNPQKDKEELKAKYTFAEGNPFKAAKDGYIDAVIDSREVKPYVASALSMLL